MLRLKGIVKDYPAGNGTVHALKGINLEFRTAEFVSILGPSGCGKTTMLNIIGGLDGYTDGDLIINGTSTKKYKDRDWDTYRNHSIGFVFQSYNLIPHQTVLQNVELALTLSGVSKSERKARAKAALEQVGLGDQIYKKPGEMSGGQMQRVAIARALVNNPDIILADEPTGALDTETSLQVMEILKEVSKDRLVIMVTHNPDLAEKYSTRIIKMLDGVITDDSMPYAEDEGAVKEAPKKAKKEKKPSMSFFTAFMLSLKNLFTKKGRTILTSFAGSIGIIGIALILAVSQGMTTYINDVQESALSAYPITLEQSAMDLTALFEAFLDVNSEGENHDKDAVYKKEALYNLVKALTNTEVSENDLKAFKEYLEKETANPESPLFTAINGIQYAYNLDLQIFTETVDGTILHSNLEKVFTDLMLKYMKLDFSAMNGMTAAGGGNASSAMSSMSMMNQMQMWEELLPGKDGALINDLVFEQYELIEVEGANCSWPNEKDEIVLVVDENNELDDVTLYALGLLSEDDIANLANAALNGTELEEHKQYKWSYKDILNTEYRLVLNSDCYHKDDINGGYADYRDTDAGVQYLYENAMPLKITGIIRPKEDAEAAMIKGSMCYTTKLTDYIIEQGKDKQIIADQIANPNVDILTGLPFNSTTGSLSDEDKKAAFEKYVKDMDVKGKAEIFIAVSSIPTQEFINAQIEQTLGAYTRPQIEAMIAEALAVEMKVSAEEVIAYLQALGEKEFNEICKQLIAEKIKADYAANVLPQFMGKQPQELAAMLDAALPTYTLEQCAAYYDAVVKFSDSTYELNLIKMGHVDKESPSKINLFAASFENKDVIVEAIDSYNNSVEELKQIKYTDYLGIIMSSITTIINAITYVLIAFVSISLVVSSIMIGVITLISVQERTKEIGILRAIGASKRDVSSMFNAETMIVGFTSGALGILVTYLLCIPINLILHTATGINNLSAILPFNAALILVAISVGLTLISGLIPSRSAAKKDPVVALRTE